MDLVTSLRLEYCVPDCWTNDLTPPYPWEAVARQPTPAEMILAWKQMVSSMSAAFNPIQSGMTSALHSIAEALEPQLKGLTETTKYVTTVETIITEQELEKHGTREAPVYKSRLGLPRKVTNTGPPENKFKRRGRK